MSQHAAPARKTSRRPSRRVLAIVGAAVLLPLLTLGSCATGAVIGAAGSDAPTERVVTKEVPVPGPTVTAPTPAPEQLPAEQVEVTPESCLVALSIAGEVIDASSDALAAAAEDDLDGINAANDDLLALDSDAFEAAIADCNGKASSTGTGA